MQDVSLIYYRYFCIVIHTCQRHIYLLWLAFICTVFQHFICHLWSARISFRLFRVPVNCIIRIFWFRIIFNKMILWSTSEASIWFPTVMFITFIIKVLWIKGWFLIDILLSLLLKAFLGWFWTSTVTAPWLRKILSRFFLLNCPNSNNQFISQI